MSNQLDLKKTYRVILDAARDKRFISYGDLAKANDADWQKVPLRDEPPSGQPRQDCLPHKTGRC